MNYERLETPIGSFLAAWEGEKLYSFEFFREQDSEKSLPSALSSVGQKLQNCVAEFFQSGTMTWDLDCLVWRNVPDFHRRALELCSQIPCGETWTYGELATRLGSPTAARAVGGAMAKNRWPLLIPCHRVVGASGSLTGYSGVGGVSTKRELLQLEQELAGKQLPLFT